MAELERLKYLIDQAEVLYFDASVSRNVEDFVMLRDDLLDAVLEAGKLITLPAKKDREHIYDNLKDRISITEEDGVLTLTMPALPARIEKSRYKQEKAFLKSVLIPALDRYKKEKKTQVFFFGRRTIWFEHITADMLAHDVDNLEHKAVIDVISPYFMFDDRNMNIYVSSKEGDKDKTIIRIFDEDRLPELLAKERGQNGEED